MPMSHTIAQPKNQIQKISDAWVFDVYQLNTHTNISAIRNSCSIIKQVVMKYISNELAIKGIEDLNLHAIFNVCTGHQ